MLGRTELTFLRGLSEAVRRQRLQFLCNDRTPCFCITRGEEIPPELTAAAEAKKIPVLRTSISTTRFGSKVTSYLEKRMAPATTMHGVLVDIYGVGVLHHRQKWDWEKRNGVGAGETGTSSGGG